MGIVFYGKGINLYNINNNPLKTIHAEEYAIDNLKKSNNIKKIDIFVFRINNHECQMAKPCKNCMNYIHKNIYKKNYRIRRIYYTDWDGNVVKL